MGLTGRLSRGSDYRARITERSRGNRVSARALGSHQERLGRGVEDVVDRLGGRNGGRHGVVVEDGKVLVRASGATIAIVD